MEISRVLNLSCTLVRAHPVLIHRTRGVPIRKSAATTHRHPLVPSSETSRDDSVARQRALISDSLDDEQWSDDLSMHRRIRQRV